MLPHGVPPAVLYTKCGRWTLFNEASDIAQPFFQGLHPSPKPLTLPDLDFNYRKIDTAVVQHESSDAGISSCLGSGRGHGPYELES
jgi:hypothetical protein